jgi:uncharacterized damage-inducible protein DinB
MRQTDVIALFQYNYWANWTILAAAAMASEEQFTAPASITWRNLRGTLVHTLDVEQSWRRRLQGEPKSVWDAELPAERFETAQQLEAYWRSDAREMLDWLAHLEGEQLAAIVDLGPRDQFPLWYFLVHIVTHGTEQRRDASIVLKSLGLEAPPLEFLWYADSLAGA